MLSANNIVRALSLDLISEHLCIRSGLQVTICRDEVIEIIVRRVLYQSLLAAAHWLVMATWPYDAPMIHHEST